jgi:hypothetical protein
LPSVSIKATSTPSSEVPLIRPIAVIIIVIVPSVGALPLTPGLCQTSTSYNATARPAAAAYSAGVP